MDDMMKNGMTGLFLAILAVFDLKYKKIPVLLFLFFGILATAIAIYMGIDKNAGMLKVIMDCLLGILPGIFLIGVSVFSRNQIGVGDGLSFIITGIMLGFLKNMCLMCYSLVMVSVLSAILLVSKKGSRKKELPFLPAVFLCYLAEVMFGWQ